MIYERVKYKLIDRDRGTQLEITSDPINWDEAEKTLKRSEKTFGIFTELSMDLGFVEEAYDFLLLAYINKDIEADVIMEERRSFPDKDGFYLKSVGHFDFSKINNNELTVNIPFKTGGLNALIKAQLKEKFELDRLESINGKVIDALSIKNVALTSRDILLISELETDALDELSTSFRMNFSDGNLRTGSLGIPTTIVVPSDDKIQNVIRDASFTTTPNNGESLSIFYLNNDVEKILSLHIIVDSIIKVIKVDDLANEFLHVSLAKFGNGLTLDLISRTILHDVDMSQINGSVIDVDFTTDTTLLPGESLSLQWYGGGNFGGFLNDGDLKVDFEKTLATITITESSVREKTQSETALFHDVGEKLLQIISGEKLKFRSEFYGTKDLGYSKDGEFSLTGLSLGFWIRQFFEKKIEFSLDNFINTSNAIHNTGYTIEMISGKEVFVMEDMKYFFQNSVAIIIKDQVSNIERSAASKMHYANMSFGYKQPSGDNLYEEAMGLDEYNTQTGYTNPITRVDHKYEKISDARADGYGMEFARRKSKQLFPEEDTRYDKSLFILDLKEGLGDALEQRVWQDDFEEAPTGVFSPDTATGLRLTPFRNSERHQWFFGSGLTKFTDQSVRHSNTIGNSNLSTKKVGEAAVRERDSIKITDLERPRFINKWITFEVEIDFDLNEQIYGTTEIDGRQIPNYFFKVEFINNDGLKEFGYIFEVAQKDDKISKIKLLKAL